ncbi:DUF5011 domain-containing protein [Pseudomonadales bacterium]|nr:DUF5011 domain-containing protein [Pseudomonadales bacterium]
MLIASGQEIEGKTDDPPANETSDGDPDYYLIEIDTDVPTGITLRLKADDCDTCSAVNFVLIDKSTDAILAAENSEQSSTSSEQLIQQEYNITGSTYVKVFSSGRNREYELTVWVNQGRPYRGEVEPNNSKLPDDYNVLSKSQEFRGNISTINDRDYIRFTPSTGVASFKIDAEGCDEDKKPESSVCAERPSLNWEIINPDGDLINSGQTQDDTTNQTQVFEIPIRTIGEDHYIQFKSAHEFVNLDRTFWSNRSYSVSYYEVPSEEQKRESEPNNNFDEAEKLVSGTTYEGNISSATEKKTSEIGDLDTFLIEVSGESGVAIRLKADDSSRAKAVHFEIIDKATNKLVASENAEQTVGNNSEQIIEANYNIVGDAYLQVFSNQRGQDYELTAFVNDGTPYAAEFEPNNTEAEAGSEQANTLKNGIRASGNISADGDVDWYVVESSRGDATFFISTEGCDKDSFGENDTRLDPKRDCEPLQIELLDKDKNVLSFRESDPGNANQLVTLSTGLQEGSSYLKISSTHTFSELGGKTYHNRTYEVTGFFPPKPVAVSASTDDGGSIFPNGRQEIPYNGSITFTATPRDDTRTFKEFETSCEGIKNTRDNTITLSNVTGDCSIKATFYPALEIRAVDTGGGTVSPQGDIPVAYNSTPSFQANPNPGYRFDRWTTTCQGDYSQRDRESSTLTLKPVTTSCQLFASFDEDDTEIDVSIVNFGAPFSVEVTSEDQRDEYFYNGNFAGRDSFRVEEETSFLITTNEDSRLYDLKVEGTGCGTIRKSGNGYLVTKAVRGCEISVEINDISSNTIDVSIINNGTPFSVAVVSEDGRTEYFSDGDFAGRDSFGVEEDTNLLIYTLEDQTRYQLNVSGIGCGTIRESNVAANGKFIPAYEVTSAARGCQISVEIVDVSELTIQFGSGGLSSAQGTFSISVNGSEAREYSLSDLQFGVTGVYSLNDSIEVSYEIDYRVDSESELVAFKGCDDTVAEPIGGAGRTIAYSLSFSLRGPCNGILIIGDDGSGIVTNTAPWIVIEGAATMMLNVGETWNDPGALVLDDEDGDLTANVIVTNPVDSSTPGSYTMEYRVTDSGGLTSTVTRNVIVVQPLATGAVRIAAGQVMELPIVNTSLVAPDGSMLVVPASATAASINVTAVTPGGGGFITVWPCGVERPLASNLNYVAGDVVPNGVIAPIGSNGKVCFYSLSDTDLVVDVAGWFEGDAFVGATPLRLVDTRETSRVTPVETLVLKVADINANTATGVATIIPFDVGAVALNVTVVSPDSAGFVTVYPCDVERPLASNVNYVAGQIVPNGVIAPVSANGEVCVYSLANTDIVADLAGWFPGNAFTAATPQRLVDTRNGTGGQQGKLMPNGQLSVPVRDAILSVAGNSAQVPQSATAAALNVTIVNPEGSGFATVWPCSAARPLASNLNFVSGQVVANNVIAPIGDQGNVCFYSSTPSHIIVDIAGYFSGESGNQFMGSTPKRFIDSRSGLGPAPQ